MAVSNYFDRLTDTEFAMDAAIILAAFLAPAVVAPVIESVFRDLPNELYGIMEIVVAQAMMDGSERVLVQYGGAVYTLDQLLARFGVRSSIVNMLSDMGSGSGGA